MDKMNIGLINYIVSSKLKNNYLNGNVVSESKLSIDKLFETILNSKILQLEFKIYNNLEFKEIEDDIMASRYIDNNLRLLEVYDKDEVLEEHKILENFKSVSLENIPKQKIELYKSINNLIMESLKNPNDVDVDTLHESFSHVLSHIKKPKQSNLISEDFDYTEDIIEIAINKFNDKYSNMSEDEKLLFKTLTTSTLEEKEELLESYKVEILDILEKHNSDNIKESIDKAKQKISEMVFSENDVDTNIISLFEFKKEL